MIDIRGFFLGYREFDDIFSIVMRWLAFGSVVGMILIMIFVPMFVRIELR